MMNRQSRQAIFDQVRALHKEGRTTSDIVRQTGFQRRTIAKWIRADTLPARRPQSIDSATGRLISPIVAAALCVKPRGLLTSAQAAKVDAMKNEWPGFAAMRRLAMRFRGMMRSNSAGKLDTWLKDVQQSGLYTMQRLGSTLRGDIDAVRNAITEQWSIGQTERQINRLKTLKRAMYGRTGPELLRARMLPL
jgi:transposase